MISILPIMHRHQGLAPSKFLPLSMELWDNCSQPAARENESHEGKQLTWYESLYKNQKCTLECLLPWLPVQLAGFEEKERINWIVRPESSPPLLEGLETNSLIWGDHTSPAPPYTASLSCSQWKGYLPNSYCLVCGSKRTVHFPPVRSLHGVTLSWPHGLH